jgi:hypothetical protein
MSIHIQKTIRHGEVDQPRGSVVRRTRREIVGQLIRLVVAGPGSRAVIGVGS